MNSEDMILLFQETATSKLDDRKAEADTFLTSSFHITKLQLGSMHFITERLKEKSLPIF
jgi:hypothetical protein